MPTMILLTILAALFLFWVARRERKATGLPGGRVIYSDTQKWNKVDEPLYSAELGLAGKPDYIIETGKWIIPVEVKSTRVNEGPYDSHVYQLAAYCLLVEQTYGERPPYGIINYANRTFQVDFTSEIETQTLNLIEEIRAQARRHEIDRSHTEAGRCHDCGYRTICDQRLN